MKCGPLGTAVDELVAARGLDRALDRFGTGVAEEDLVGKAPLGQRLGKPLLFRNAEEVGDMPDLPGLRRQRGDELRVGMAERVDGDPAGEVEEASAVGGLDPGAFAAHEGEGRTNERVIER